VKPKKKQEKPKKSKAEDSDEEEEVKPKKKQEKAKAKVVVEEDSSDDEEVKPKTAEKEEEEKSDKKAKKEKPVQNTKLFPNANQNNKQKQQKQQQQQQRNPNQLFEVQVTKMPADVTEAEIKDFFGACGSIAGVKLVKGEGEKGGDIAYIKFRDRDGLDNALDINEIKWKTVFITVKRSTNQQKSQRPQNTQNPKTENKNAHANKDAHANKPAQNANDKKVYVGNLYYYSNEQDLKFLFESCGEVVSIKRGMDKDGNVNNFFFMKFINLFRLLDLPMSNSLPLKELIRLSN